MLPDIDKYMPYLDEYDLPRAQKEDIIRTVWTFVESYADLEFGLHPSQQIGGYHGEFNLQSQGGFLYSKVSTKNNK